MSQPGRTPTKLKGIGYSARQRRLVSAGGGNSAVWEVCLSVTPAYNAITSIGRLAPTADVCDKGVFWKSPLRPRTMLSLKKAGILSCATRPD
jgi:hypothetical protein